MDFKEIIHSEKAYEILGADMGTWTAGGCLILAKALWRYLKDKGCECELWGVMSKGELQHAVVKVDDLFLDADGAFHRDVMLEKMVLDDVSMPYLEPLTEEVEEKASDFVFCPIEKVKAVQSFLVKKKANLPEVVSAEEMRSLYW